VKAPLLKAARRTLRVAPDRCRLRDRSAGVDVALCMSALERYQRRENDG
jgi:hypothetical protein